MEFKTFNDLPDIPEEKIVQDNTPRPALEEVRTMRQHIIPKYPMFIGRDAKANISLPISAVSRKHAKVYEENGIFYIQDLGSINGTFVNEKRIIDPVPLKPGDRVKISVTKQYPHGVKEFEFKHDLSQQKQLQKDRDMLLQDVHIFADDGSSSKTIPLKDCFFYVTKKDIVSVLKSDPPRRVPLNDLSFKKGELSFLSLCPYKPKDILTFSIEHPNISSPIKFQIKVTDVQDLEKHNIFSHGCEIIKLPDEDRKNFKEKIDMSPIICYINCKLKEEIPS